MTITRTGNLGTKTITKTGRNASVEIGSILDLISKRQRRITYGDVNGVGEILNEIHYGEYLFVPATDFTGYVEMWGAGGGVHSHSNLSYGGGGGYARSTIRFQKDIPYMLIVGQGGNYGGDGSSHLGRGNGDWSVFEKTWARGVGGGGPANNHGGGGGGLTGIFYNSFGSTVYPTSTRTAVSTSAPPWTNQSGVTGGSLTLDSGKRGTLPPGRSNALLIAGGGGGGGHSGAQSSHHGQAGGGGGLTGNSSHNGGGGTQTAGGAAGYSANAGSELAGGHSGGHTYVGAGGGGWFGGGGGGHTANTHYNGGGGGSGHAIDLYTSGPNASLLGFVSGSYLETAPGVHGTSTPNPAQYTNSKRSTYAGVAGGSSNLSPPIFSYAVGGDGQMIISLQKAWG